jgi:large subunit ribosomal protein L33
MADNSSKKQRNVRLECGVCHHINYLTFRNPKSVTEKLQLNKYCKWCKKTTLHKETKAK